MKKLLLIPTLFLFFSCSPEEAPPTEKCFVVTQKTIKTDKGVFVYFLNDTKVNLETYNAVKEKETYCYRTTPSY